MDAADNVATIAVPLTLDTLAGILVGGLEGGINYWCRGVKANFGTKTRKQFEEEHKELIKKVSFGVLPILPFVPGCSLLIIEDEEEGNFPEHNLTLEKLQKGLDILAKRYPQHVKNIIEDNADAETGDVLIQCALLGDIVYG